MSPRIEIDSATYGTLKFAADLQGVTPSEIVRQLVARTSGDAGTGQDLAADGPSDPTGVPAVTGTIPCHMDYEGARTAATFDTATQSITITSGPLEGKRFKSPSGAAAAVVSEANPSINPNRNGWATWCLEDGRLLQAARS